MTDHNEGTHDETSERGLSRRQALKKAGIVGAAAVWATPAVQVAFAPAAIAASPGGGGTCKGWTDSSSGFCGGAAGCPRCAAGRACNDNSDCLSSDCVSKGKGKSPRGVCAKSTAGEACYDNADCTTGFCGDKVNGVGVCKQGNPGNSCSVASDCFNGRCNNGTCAKSQANEVCRTTDDCETGLVCTKDGVNWVCKPTTKPGKPK